MSRLIIHQFIKYFAFSGIAALANIGLRFSLSTLSGVNFYLAVTIAYLLGMVINFALNKNLNFPRGPRPYYHEARSFVVVALVGLLLTNLFASFYLFTFDEVMTTSLNAGVKETIALITAVGLVSIYSFFAHKYLTYRNGLRSGIRELVNYFD